MPEVKVAWHHQGRPQGVLGEGRMDAIWARAEAAVAVVVNTDRVRVEVAEEFDWMELGYTCLGYPGDYRRPMSRAQTT